MCVREIERKYVWGGCVRILQTELEQKEGIARETVESTGVGDRNSQRDCDRAIIGTVDLSLQIYSFRSH